MAQYIASILNELAKDVALPDIAGVHSFITDYFGSVCDFTKTGNGMKLVIT